MNYFTYIKFLNKILIKEHKKNLIMLIFLMIVLVIFESFSFSLILPIVESLLPTERNVVFFESIFKNFNFLNIEYKFIFFSSIFLILYLSKIIFNIFFSWYQNNFFCKILTYLSDQLYKKYINQNIIFHKNADISILLRNLNSELSIFLREGMASIISIISDILIIFTISLIILIYEPVITCFLILFLSFFSYIFIKINRFYLNKWSNERQNFEGLRLKFLNQGLFSIKEIKIYNKENWVTNKFYTASKKTFLALRNYDFFQILPRMFLEFLLMIAIMLCLLIFFKSKEINVALSYLGIIVFASFRILPILSKLLRSIQSLAYSKSAYELLKKEFSLEHANFQDNKFDKAIFNKNIKFKNLSFKYDGSKNSQINNINLEIKKNDCIGIMGESGQGKSTLIDLIIGLLKPDHGEILVDQVDIKNNYRSWQNLIGYVPQNVYLSDDTIANNIAFGEVRENIDQKKLLEVIEQTKLKKLIDNLPNGVNEHVGSQGNKLSGGEKQRIAIARALYFNPEILILDEATSSLDENTEERVMESIKGLFDNKTSIIVAHRKSALINCNKIFSIENGEIKQIN